MRQNEKVERKKLQFFLLGFNRKSKNGWENVGLCWGKQKEGCVDLERVGESGNLCGI